LSIVDNHTCNRLLYQVLDHAPDHQDSTAFVRRFRMALQLRGLVVRGVTTDGSPLYPEPLRAVFGEVPHQSCEFHILKELTQAILRAVAKGAQSPGRAPAIAETRASGHAGSQTRRLPTGTDTTENWGTLCAAVLVVQHDVTPAERRTVHHITRGLPQLRTLRAIMEEVYRVFDRRCRTDTALAKLAQLRQRVRRYSTSGLLTSCARPTWRRR
jgi:hypothetical protein